jgi:hypothetical protein
MKQDKSNLKDPEIITSDSELDAHQDAVNEIVDEYEISANSEQPTEVNPATQKELGEVERALEDSVMGIEDAS